MGDPMKLGRASLVRKLGLFAVFATLGAVVGVVFIASKLGSDEQVMSDIDRHFEQLDAMKVDSPMGEEKTTVSSRHQNRVKNGKASATVGKAPRSTSTHGSEEPKKRTTKVDEAAEAAGEPPSSPRWQGIEKIAPKTYIIDNQLVAKVRKRPQAFIKGIQAKLVEKDGQPIGYKLHGIGQKSAIRAIDIRNGDILLAVNGLPLNGIDEAILAATSLRFATKYRVDLERGGRTLSYYYRIK